MTDATDVIDAAADAAPTDTRLSTEQIAEVLRLLRGSDSVELKLSVPDTNRRSAIASLGIDALDAQIRQVAFFDTPDLTLNRNGVVVRARRVQRKPGDAIVKIRPLVPDEVPPAVRKSAAFGVEVDAMPGGFVCSGTMKAEVDDAPVKEAMAGRQPLRKLLGKEQRALFSAYAPDGRRAGRTRRPRPDQRPQGQVHARGLRPPHRCRALALPRRVSHPGAVHEVWPAEAFDVAAETRVFLGDHGIDLLAEQQTKTKTALEFFAAELQGTGGK